MTDDKSRFVSEPGELEMIGWDSEEKAKQFNNGLKSEKAQNKDLLDKSKENIASLVPKKFNK